MPCDNPDCLFCGKIELSTDVDPADFDVSGWVRAADSLPEEKAIVAVLLRPDPNNEPVYDIGYIHRPHFYSLVGRSTVEPLEIVICWYPIPDARY